MNKCYKTIENKLSRTTTFQIPELSTILGELKTLGVNSYLRKNEQIKSRSFTSVSRERCEKLNKDHIKQISIEKNFLHSTRGKYKIPGSISADRHIFRILSESQNFLDSRLAFWAQI